jgi:hypothetical protein
LFSFLFIMDDVQDEGGKHLFCIHLFFLFFLPPERRNWAGISRTSLNERPLDGT